MINPMLAVKDVDASVAFYVEKLGFKHDFSMPGPDGKTAFGWVSLGKAGFGLQLVPDLEQRGNGVVFMYSVPEETDIDQYYAAVQDKSVKIAEPIQDAYWGDRTFSVRDPDGYMLSPYKTTKQVTAEEVAAVMRGEQHA